MLALYNRILDRLRWEYREWRRPSRASFVQDELDQALLDEIAWTPSERVLDVGCAHGVYMQAMQDRGLRPVGIDISMPCLRQAHDAGHTVAAASGIALPFANASFDAIVSHKTMHLFDAPASVIREFDRVLRPGGRIVFSGSNTQSPYARISEASIRNRKIANWGFSNRWPPQKWCQAFGAHGYSTRSVFSCNLAWPWVYRICDTWLLPNEWMRRYVKWVRRMTRMPLRTKHPHGAAMDYVVELVKPRSRPRRPAEAISRVQQATSRPVHTPAVAAIADPHKTPEAIPAHA